MREVCSIVALVFVLAGCTAAETNTVVDPPPASPSVSAASPSGSASASPSPSADGIPAGAYDVRGYGSADFASPDGSIRCSLTVDDATCNFPAGMKRSGVPSARKICPGAPLKVQGVTVSGLAEFFCSRGDDAHPQQKGSAAIWARNAGVPTVTVGSEVLVTLPDGHSLVHGKLYCTSAGGAITCAQAQTKASFSISADGVKLSSGE